jgi:plastocyanin
MTARLLAVWLVGLGWTELAAETIQLWPSRNNTLYEVLGFPSNAKGQFIFSGRTGRGDLRRALLMFDVADELPPNARITNATLALTISLAPSGVGDSRNTLHRLLADWGEGESVAVGPEGLGANPTPGDATWAHRFFPDVLWTGFGGDFATAASASAPVGLRTGEIVTWSGDGMVSDLQHWLDAPANNFGWVLCGDENDQASDATARRFNGRHHVDASSRPRLIVTYEIGDPHPGRTQQVLIHGGGFLPAEITVEPGDKVVWFATVAGRNVTAEDGGFDSQLIYPEGIPSAESFEKVFETPGIYPYRDAATGDVEGSSFAGVVRVVVRGDNVPPNRPVPSEPASGERGVSTSPLLRVGPFRDLDDGDEHLATQWILQEFPGGGIVLDTGEDRLNLTSLRLAGLESNREYRWKARFKDSRGSWGAFSVPATFVTDNAIEPNGAGLVVTYFQHRLAKGPGRFLGSSLDSMIDFDWGLGKPGQGVPANNFLAQWEGLLLPEFSERYLFRVRAAGGVRMWVNNQMIIDDWVSARFPLFRSGAVELEAGKLIPMRIAYFHETRHASIQVRWTSRSQALEVIPAGRLFPEAP